MFAHDLYVEVKSFQTQLALFAKQMSNENFVHFPTLKSQSVNAASAKKCSELITGLREEFARTFADFKAMEHEFDLLKSPFSCDVETVATELQVELIDLQADNALKSSFEKKSLIEFYKSLHPEKSRNLKFARKMFVVFASTYICKQTFSSMKINKSKNRSLLTDSNLQAVLRVSSSSFKPDFDKLLGT